jgi:hypothetical protein
MMAHLTGYGKQAGLSARGGLLVTGLLVAAVAWMLATGYDSANARARDAASYCEQLGRRYNVHGQAVRQPQVSDDGMQTWEDVR